MMFVTHHRCDCGLCHRVGKRRKNCRRGIVGQRQRYKQQTRTENKEKEFSSKDLKGQKSSSIDEVSDSNLRCLRLCLRYGRGPAICLIPRMEMFVAPSEMAIIRLWGS